MLPNCFDLMRFTHVHSENYNLHIRKGIENCGVYFSMWLLQSALWGNFGQKPDSLTPRYAQNRHEFSNEFLPSLLSDLFIS